MNRAMGTGEKDWTLEFLDGTFGLFYNAESKTLMVKYDNKYLYKFESDTPIRMLRPDIQDIKKHIKKEEKK